MTTRNRTHRQAMIYKTGHCKLTVEQQERHKKPR